MDELDEVYFDLQESFEEGNIERDQSPAAFAKARAVNAALFALTADAIEVAYEANAATDDMNGVRNVINAALVQP